MTLIHISSRQGLLPCAVLGMPANRVPWHLSHVVRNPEHLRDPQLRKHLMWLHVVYCGVKQTALLPARESDSPDSPVVLSIKVRLGRPEEGWQCGGGVLKPLSNVHYTVHTVYTPVVQVLPRASGQRPAAPGLLQGFSSGDELHAAPPPKLYHHQNVA